VHLDVTREARLAGSGQTATDARPLDILINNAASSSAACPSRRSTVAGMDQVVAVNAAACSRSNQARDSASAAAGEAPS